MRKLHIAALLLAILGAGCSGHGPKATNEAAGKVSSTPPESLPDFIPDPHGWFIESYDHGVFTIQHEGYTYLAKCSGGAFGPPYTISKVSSMRRSISEGGARS